MTLIVNGVEHEDGSTVTIHEGDAAIFMYNITEGDYLSYDMPPIMDAEGREIVRLTLAEVESPNAAYSIEVLKSGIFDMWANINYRDGSVKKFSFTIEAVKGEEPTRQREVTVHVNGVVYHNGDTVVYHDGDDAYILISKQFESDSYGGSDWAGVTTAKAVSVDSYTTKIPILSSQGLGTGTIHIGISAEGSAQIVYESVFKIDTREHNDQEVTFLYGGVEYTDGDTISIDPNDKTQKQYFVINAELDNFEITSSPFKRTSRMYNNVDIKPYGFTAENKATPEDGILEITTGTGTEAPKTHRFNIEYVKSEEPTE